jgi:3-dehydroquinate synthase
MNDLMVQSRIHDYVVKFERDLSFLSTLCQTENAIFVIDENVFNLYKDHFIHISDERFYVFKAIESNKTINEVIALYHFFMSCSPNRNTKLISIGGGIVQDVTGFVASSLYRGLHWIFLPTTFLSQADSCIGSKTSLNFDKYKNILGGFYPPNEIYIATEFLNTLSREDFFSGIGEVIKFHLLQEKYPKDTQKIIQITHDLLDRKNVLEAIVDTLTIKSEYIKIDEFDKGKRNLFNYGHCFGHALETSSNYKVPHGIAVTVGMIYANIVAKNRRLLSEAIHRHLVEHLFKIAIPIEMHKVYFMLDTLIAAMRNDKKRVSGMLTIIIPQDDDFRAIKVDDMTDIEFASALEELIVELNIQ